MSRCLLDTGTSTGSTIVPPEWWSPGLRYANFTKLRKSWIVAYRRPSSRLRTNGEPYAGTSTVALPPTCTLRSGLRACCV